MDFILSKEGGIFNTYPDGEGFFKFTPPCYFMEFLRTHLIICQTYVVLPENFCHENGVLGRIFGDLSTFTSKNQGETIHLHSAS